ncbi:MAG: hypothetical protein MUF42_14240 [Cytophagaceae bacterium]|nr:hypothetical protein [Cytophagaceae bacterium]
MNKIVYDWCRKPIVFGWLLLWGQLVLAQNFQWAKQLGGTASQTITGSALDLSGNLYVCGKYSGSIDVDPGAGTLTFSGSGYYFGKYDEGGNLLWAKPIPNGGFLREIYGITYSSSDNSITVVGVFDVSTSTSLDFDPGSGTAYAPSVQDNSSFIAKYSASDGAFQWVRFLMGNIVLASCVTSDGSGNLYIGGTFYLTIDFDPGTGVQSLTAGAADGYVLKLNSSGAFQAVYRFGSPLLNDDVHSVATDGAGSLYVSGSGNQDLDMDPTAGTALIPSGGGLREGYLTKLTSAGAFAWSKYFLSTGNDLPMCVKVSPSGNPHITGSYGAALKINNTTTNNLVAPTGTSDLFLISFNGSGTLQFAINSAEAGDERGLDIAFEAGTGGTTVVGLATVSSINSALIYKYTTAGVFSAASNISDGVNMTATCVEAAGNEVIVCGNFSGTADFNPSAATANLSCTTPTDAFMRKIMNGTCVTGTITNITASAVAVCPGGSSVLSVNGNLNNNNSWEWRTGSCTGTLVGTGVSITVSPSAATTYFVKAMDGCAAASTCQSQALTIQTLPTITATTPGSSCGTGVIALTATPSSGSSVQWFSTSSGGSVIGTGNAFATPSISTTTTYYAGAVINGCTSSSRTAVLATVHPMPTVSSTTPVTRCGAGSGTLSAFSSNGTLQWLTENNFFLANGATYTATVSSTTNFKVQAITANCTSPTTTVVFTVNAIPSIISANEGLVCGPGTVTISASPSASASISWFANAAGGSALSTGTSYTTNAITTSTTYYAQATLGPCHSARTPVQASVVAVPAITSSLGASRCGSGSLTLTASPSPIASVEWYASSSGGQVLATGNTYVTPSLSSTTDYYAQAVNSGCASNRVPVSASVSPLPEIISSTPGERCGAGLGTISATSNAGNVRWYANAAGGAILFTGNSYSPNANLSTTYYAEAVSGSCLSANRTPVGLTIHPQPSSGLSLNGNELSATETNPLASFQWIDCNSSLPVSGATSQAFIPNISGSYHVEVSINACSVVSSCQAVVINSLFMETEGDVKFKFENPVQSELIFTTDDSEGEYLIYTLDGTLLERGSIAQQMGSIPMEDLPPGIFILQVKAGTFAESFRLVKQ